MNAISSLTQGGSKSSLALFLPFEDTTKIWQSATGKSFLTRHNRTDSLISDSSLQNC